MKRKSKQQEYLMQYVGLKSEIANIERLKDKRLKERLQPRIEENRRKMEEIERVVESAADPVERSILRAKYIDVDDCELPTWPTVAIIIYGRDDESKMQAVFRLHGRALQSIAPAIAEIEKSRR